MFKDNLPQILSKIGDNDRVLDIGAWAQPFCRADYVIDIMPYESRGVFGTTGEGPERFTKDTWIYHDISGRKPLPFEDKFFDFVICSHVLEDIRDPVNLCSEIIRVGKRGYIEVPSRTMEVIWGVERSGYTGYYHHRWLVDIAENRIEFRFKSALLLSGWRYHLPHSHLKRLSETDKVSWLFWDNSFDYAEIIEISDDAIMQGLERFVRERQGYPAWYYALAPLAHPGQSAKRLVKNTPAIRAVAEKLLGRQLADERSVWSDLPVIRSN